MTVGLIKHHYITNLIALISLFSVSEIYAQIDVPSSQFMNTQFFVNPGYTGIQKAMNITGTARQQWLGIDGAPQKYQFGFDSPLNNSLSGMGLGILMELYGPYKMNMIHANYSRLIKVSSGSFLSLGFSGSISNYSLGLGDLDLNHPDDPLFSENVNNSFAPNIGVGAFFFTQKFYIGASAPKLLSEKPFEENESTSANIAKFYYLSSGFLYSITNEISIKPAFLLQMKDTDFNYLAIGSQVIVNNRFYIGAIYQTQKWISALANIQITEAINIGYSFDFGINQEYAKNYSHEISLRYSINSFYKKNRSRDFSKKSKRKGPQPIEESMKNLRRF